MSNVEVTGGLPNKAESCLSRVDLPEEQNPDEENVDH
jgi:hypothetical protein